MNALLAWANYSDLILLASGSGLFLSATWALSDTCGMLKVPDAIGPALSIDGESTLDVKPSRPKRDPKRRGVRSVPKTVTDGFLEALQKDYYRSPAGYEYDQEEVDAMVLARAQKRGDRMAADAIRRLEA